jgi:predicted amidophosphoribosyltransferase
MDTNCSKCGAHLSSAWSFCPACGTAVTHEVHPSAHQHHPARGAFGGLYYGLIAAPILIIPGVLLCLLGWGIFFGVPMIVLGITAPLVGPVLGMGEHKGKCPSCGTRMISIADSKEHDCPICNKKFAIEDAEVAGVR